jgi:hypothetical protein
MSDRSVNLASTATRPVNRTTAADRQLTFVAPRHAKPKRTVLVHGLVYFGRVFAELMDGDGWSFHYYPDTGVRNLVSMAACLRSCDLIYQVGGRVTCGRFLRVARFFEKSKIVMHWVGSDTLDEQRDVSLGHADPWVLRSIHHWAESDWMVREVNALGLPCERVPLPSKYVPDEPSPLPRDFRVLVYVPTLTRSALYGLDSILQVVKALPHVSFDLVGLRDGPLPECPRNLTVHNRIPNLREFYKNCSVVWRPARHDGVSWMVMESLGHGRHVLWTYPFPGCIQAVDADEARHHIVRLHEQHVRGLLPINSEGANFMSQGSFHPKRLRQEIHSRLTEILGS